MCFRRGKNLSDALVWARLPSASRPLLSTTPIVLRMAPSFRQHSTPCGTPLCKCCGVMSRAEVVYSKDAHFPTPSGTSCNSRGVVYLIKCRLCTSRCRYVGQTARDLRTRVAGHRRDFGGGKNMPLYKHFKRPGHSFEDVQVTILEVVAPCPTQRLLERELHWIQRLQTTLPHGLNSQYRPTAS